MSILQDPVRPLDMFSQQKFAERSREAEAEREGPEPLEESSWSGRLSCPRPDPCTEAAMGWCEWECELTED
jgi:hypothetical protein